MSLLTVNNLVVSSFAVYLAYTAYSLSTLLAVPTCEPGDVCLKPYLGSDHPRLQLLMYTSRLSKPSYGAELSLVHHDLHFDYLSPTGEAGLQVNISLPRAVRHKNQTMHLHMFLLGGDVNIKSFEDVQQMSAETGYATCQLAVHHVPPPQPFSLMADHQNDTTTQRSAPSDRPTVHLRQQVTFSLMTELRPLPLHRLPPEIAARLRLVSPSHYLPLLHVEQLSHRLDHLQPVADLPALTNTTLHYRETSLPRLRLWLQFEGALESLAQLGFTPKDVDEVKGIFETNLTLLCVTFCVALLHLLFDVLAFKHDISFWKGRTTMAGLSGGTVVWRAFAQIVITLHLLEEDTSLLVLGPAAVAVFIELWKVQKTVRLRWSVASDTSPSAALEQETQALDSEAFRRLCYVLLPLCTAGAVYSLLYMPHKSWYSWVLSSTVNGVYALGFVFMLPQLFINYRLKSVAHLPWRAFMYKAFNTFIDDLFAFIITMPTSHRVACFRDDVVFLIYLYQRWLYPVDSSRVNEFGSSGGDAVTESSAAGKSKRE